MAAPDPFRRRLRVHWLVWVGIAVVVLGTGPLLAIIAAAALGWTDAAAALGWTDDPNSNPVGPGLLAGCTFVPGLVLGATGAVLTIVEYMRDRPGTGG